MSRNGRPSENKVHEPKHDRNAKGTKDRKGGKKARKLAPQRRLEQTLTAFTGTSAELTKHKHLEEERIKRLVNLGVKKPMSGEEFQATINRPRHKQVNPLKIARLLMPNSF